jgi:DNA-binding CsgD family transcriptional regulator
MYPTAFTSASLKIVQIQGPSEAKCHLWRLSADLPELIRPKKLGHAPSISVSRFQTYESTAYLMEALRTSPSCEGIDAGKIDQLSPRELQVAKHAAQGESNKQIADRLSLSEHTVKNYLFHVFEKLGVSNRFELLFLLFKERNPQTPGSGWGALGD